jgi:hypothetical protein
MSRKQFLAAELIAIAASAAGAFLDPIWSLPGALLAAILLIAQYVQPRGTDAVPFGTNDWVRQGDEWVLTIPSSRHGLRAPSPHVFKMGGDGSWQEIMCEVRADNARNVVVRINASPGERRFVGQIRFD